MKKLLASVMALALGTSAGFAGGPVVVVEEPVVEAAKPRSGWIVPVIIGLVVICAIACGDDDEGTAST
jgi:hypothetical protein